MTSARFAVIRAGPQVTVQDRGRAGMMRYGVPASGPMDRTAFRIANLALGNAQDTPAIEVSQGGLTLHCTDGEVSFAVAGGSFHISIDGQRLAPWCVATVGAGQTLAIQPGRWGAWCYLAFAGALQARRWLGSASTHGPSDLGGGTIVTGDNLTVEAAQTRPQCHAAIAIPVSARPRSRVRVVLGPQTRFFADQTIETLLTQPFMLTDASDRMGVRLSGPALHPAAALDMPSEPILRGSVQVAGDGVATVLLADHQTTGGYPKIATLLSADVDGFAQLRSRNPVRFEAIPPEAAIAAARTRHESMERYLSQWPLP